MAHLLQRSSTGSARPINSSAARESQTTAPRRSRRGRRGRLSAWIVIVLFGGFGLLPVYWLVVTSFTPRHQAFTYPPRLFPKDLTLQNFANLVDSPEIARYLTNSLIVSTITALLSVAVSAYMGYSFSKYRYRGRRSLMYFVLSSQMFPHALMLVTLYAVFSAYGLLNTYIAMIVSFTTFTLPLCVWMLKGFFDTIPDSLVEAGRVDGASRMRILHSIVLPLSAPGLIAAGLFAFIRGWNDFIFALTLAGPDKLTLPPGLVNSYMGEASSNWSELMAASVAASLPVVVAFILLQRYLVGGIAGALKG